MHDLQKAQLEGCPSCQSLGTMGFGQAGQLSTELVPTLDSLRLLVLHLSGPDTFDTLLHSVACWVNVHPSQAHSRSRDLVGCSPNVF